MPGGKCKDMEEGGMTQKVFSEFSLSLIYRTMTRFANPVRLTGPTLVEVPFPASFGSGDGVTKLAPAKR
jgi:hypothetical protein